MATDTTCLPSAHVANPAGQAVRARGGAGHLGDLRDLASRRQAGSQADAGAPARKTRAGGATAIRARINALPSGPKIPAPGVPHDTTLDTLPAEDITRLAAAMHLAKPGEPGSTRAEAAAIRERFAALASDLDNGFMDHYNAALLDHAVDSGKLTEAEIDELKTLMDQTHMLVKVKTVPGPNGGQATLDVFFNGTQNLGDLRQDVNTVLGMTGERDRASRRIGELMSTMLAPNGNATLRSVSGLSMGGGAAQIFTAAIDSRVQLSSRPAVVLLDPVLLNDRQARLAVRGGTRPVDFSAPRGVAITLDYARNPQRGVMSMMKSAGFHSPGLVRLKLGLEEGDGRRYDQARPKPQFGMGYHARDAYYVEAMRRFAGTGGTALAQGGEGAGALGGGGLSAAPVRRPIGQERLAPGVPRRIGTGAARLDAAASASSPCEESDEDVFALWLKADAHLR
ncbi:MAG: hypothetical protein V4801_10230 [Burkholderia gladioli]